MGPYGPDGCGVSKGALLQGDVSLPSVAMTKILSRRFLQCHVDFIGCEKLLWMQYRRTASNEKI